ncbi:uncharacterized protein LOC143198564 isoform X2 [Rhynchophorus ferrugineus]|uniref:uncharacterized protein LOC143198564 isoform X2 n=1 Tax=Rhynchophorus ferrugineus TaxID=354439 RepID=UPI003FCE438C
MDKLDTDSNYSNYSDSVVSNASSLSGLSLYEDEFTELRHLVNPHKYPSKQIERSSTPKVQTVSLDNEQKIVDLYSELEKCLQLNVRYKSDLASLEKRFELRCNDKIEQLQRNNASLEGQLNNANNQIERLIKNYKDQNVFALLEERLQLQKKIKELLFQNDTLQTECANSRQEKNNVLSENTKLKISLGELTTDLEVKKTSIQHLKDKISRQYIEIQNVVKENRSLVENNNFLTIKLSNFEKSINWYKGQLQAMKEHKQKWHDDILKYKNDLNNLKEDNSVLKIELCKCKSEIDHVRLQALKEKESLYTKLEKINLNNQLPAKRVDSVTNEESTNYFELSFQDVKRENDILKQHLTEHEERYEVLCKENSEILSKYLVLQKNLQQVESTVEVLETNKKDMIQKLDNLEELVKEKCNENFQLKNKISSLEIELQTLEQEKKTTENTIELIRNQFCMFRSKYQKVKDELSLKHKEILHLENEKQNLFMQQNWTKCELETAKQKDVVISHLNNDISTLHEKLQNENTIITDLKFKILRYEKTLNDKESVILQKQKEMENYDLVLLQYKKMHSEFENKINNLQNVLKTVENERNKLGNDYNNLQDDLKEKNLKLGQIIKRKEQLKEDKKKLIQTFTVEKQELLELIARKEQEYEINLKERENDVSNFKNKITNMESDYELYLKENTDDYKVKLKMLLSDDSFLNDVLDKLNIDEFESTINIRLKHLEEKLIKQQQVLQDLKSRVSEKNEKVKELEVLLQVKTRELKDKKICMDKNNRTLLRKLKEHMRGRNSTEKQLKYLQDLYDSLSDSHNTLILSVTEKDYLVKTLQELCGDYEAKIKSLTGDILILEQKQNQFQNCQLCLDNKEKYASFENICNELQNDNKKLECECKDLKRTINKLSEQLKKTVEDSKKFDNMQKEREAELKNQAYVILNLKESINKKEHACSQSENVIKNLRFDLDEVKEKNKYLTDENKQLSSNLQQKVEYLTKIEESKEVTEKKLVQETVRNEALLAEMKNSSLYFENEVAQLKNDKFFLQRLSNDLKIALKLYVDQNKCLKEQLLPSKGDQRVNNLPDFNSTVKSAKYDEDLINKLLLDNKASSNQAPLTFDIQDCLKKLKEEIVTLQCEIARKNHL